LQNPKFLSKGSELEIDNSDLTISGYDKTKVGKQTVTVSYEGKTAAFEVNVEAKTVTGITIKSNLAKTTYYIGGTVDLTGFKVEITYNDGSTAIVSDKDLKVLDFDSTSRGQKSVKVELKNKNDEILEFNITVKPINKPYDLQKTNLQTSSVETDDALVSAYTMLSLLAVYGIIISRKKYE